MATQPISFGTTPADQGWLNPYGQGLASLATQQLGKPIDIGAVTPGVAGPGAFSQAQQQLTSDMGGLFQDLLEEQVLLPSNPTYKVFKTKVY